MHVHVKNDYLYQAPPTPKMSEDWPYSIYIYIHAPVSFGQAKKIDHLNILNTIEDDLLKNSVPESVEGISHGPWTFCAYWFEHVNPACRSWTVSPPQRVPGEHTLSIRVILVGQFYVGAMTHTPRLDGQF